MWVRLVTVSIGSSRAHALVMPWLVADIAEFVDDLVNASVPDIIGLVLVIVFHALRAIITAFSRVEVRSGAANNDFTEILLFFFIFMFFIVKVCIVRGPLNVADDSLGIQSFAFNVALHVGDIIIEAGMVGADT